MSELLMLCVKLNWEKAAQSVWMQPWHVWVTSRLKLIQGLHPSECAADEACPRCSLQPPVSQDHLQLIQDENTSNMVTASREWVEIFLLNPRTWLIVWLENQITDLLNLKEPQNLHISVEMYDVWSVYWMWTRLTRWAETQLVTFPNSRNNLCSLSSYLWLAAEFTGLEVALSSH